MPLLDRRRVRVGLAVGSTVVAIGAALARFLLWKYNVLLDPYPLTLLTVTTVVAVLVATTFIYFALVGPSTAGSAAAAHNRQGVIAAVSLMIAAATAVYTIAQIAFPSTPQSAAAGACRGAPLQGAHALGQTTSVGANARAGAGSAYPAQDRFGADCTVGFDGFCIGEPIAAPHSVNVNDLPDQRWLIVHDRSELVAASYIRLQKPQSDLGEVPSKDCAKYHGVAGPSKLTWTAATGPKQTAQLTSTSQGSLITSYAVEYAGAQAPNSYPYVWVAAYSPLYGYVSALPYANWVLGRTPVTLRKETARLYVVGEDCYADDAPALDTARFKILTFRAGVLIGKPMTVRTVPNAKALSREACSID